jgi:hypothetical protein
MYHVLLTDFRQARGLATGRVAIYLWAAIAMRFAPPLTYFGPAQKPRVAFFGNR